jgi:hypothetical protein
MEIYMSQEIPPPDDGCGATTTEAAVAVQQAALEQEMDEMRARLGRLRDEHTASVVGCIAANPFACIAAIDLASKIADAEGRLAELAARHDALVSSICARPVSPSGASGPGSAGAPSSTD